MAGGIVTSAERQQTLDVVIEEDTPLLWGPDLKFTAPVVRFLFSEDGKTQIVTTCAVPVGQDVFVRIDGAEHRVGKASASGLDAYRIIDSSLTLGEDTYDTSHKSDAPAPRLSSKLRTIYDTVDGWIGFLAAVDVDATITVPKPDGFNSETIEVRASIMRFLDPARAADHRAILGRHLIDRRLSTAGIAVSLNEDEGYAILVQPGAHDLETGGYMTGRAMRLEIAHHEETDTAAVIDLCGDADDFSEAAVEEFGILSSDAIMARLNAADEATDAVSERTAEADDAQSGDTTTEPPNGTGEVRG